MLLMYFESCFSDGGQQIPLATFFFISQRHHLKNEFRQKDSRKTKIFNLPLQKKIEYKYRSNCAIGV